MDSSIDQRSARIVIVETVPARRMLLADIIRNFGFGAITTVDKPQDLISHLKVTPCDWIIMPLASDHNVNGMHILKIITTNPELYKIRVSMLFANEERQHIPLAFELGLLSWHPTPYNREGMTKSMEALFARLVAKKNDLTLVAADYLRQALRDLRSPQSLLRLELALSELYTGEPEPLILLAKAQIALGQKDDARRVLNHAELLAKGMKPQLDVLREQCDSAADRSAISGLTAGEAMATGQTPNLLGVKSCVIIEPDTAVQYIIKSLLKDSGVPQIELFTDGETAWKWLDSHAEPELIVMEWRLAGLTGPLLLQRLRQKGFIQVPVVVTSSLIAPGDAPLALEMGVSALIDKPFNQETFFKTVITTLQQDRRPTEQVSLDVKIRQLLNAGNLPEAERLWAQYSGDGRIPPQAKKHLEAEFLFARGDFSGACDVASQTLRESRDSLPLLNLLGKSLLKTGRYKVALKCFGRAQELSPNNVERLCRIAEVQHYLGDDVSSELALGEAKFLDSGASVVREMSASLALSKGDVKTASTLMRQLESLLSILAFMNNRAIALTRAGQFDDGIALYRNTLMALPPPWSGTHNAVSYNLGLAYARYGEIDRAMDALESVQEPIEVALKRKCDSLRHRLEEAKVNGGALQLNETLERPTKDAKTAALISDVTSTIDLRRGEICCYLVFHGDELAQQASKPLLAQLPVYLKRSDTNDTVPAPQRRKRQPA